MHTLDDVLAKARDQNELLAELVDEVVYMRGQIAELERRVGNVIRMARVTAVDGDAGTVKLTIATDDTGKDIILGDFRWGMRAGAQQEWDPPAVGEQVVLISPGGDLTLLSWAQKGGFTQEKPKTDSRLGVYKRSLSKDNFFEQTGKGFTLKAPSVHINPSGSSSTEPGPAPAPTPNPIPDTSSVPMS